jgi:hypothetical protein
MKLPLLRDIVIGHAKGETKNNAGFVSRSANGLRFTTPQRLASLVTCHLAKTRQK